MNIGIIGAGEMGRCLASKLADLKHNVSIANAHGPASLFQLANDLGIQATTIEGVIEHKDVVIISIPQKNILQLPKSLFKHLPGDVVVIDTGNYYPTLRDGIIPELVQSGIDSLWVQQQLDIPVVKVFNSILATSLHDFSKPKGEKDRIALAVSGDNEEAKDVVCKLVDTLGFDALDLGTIAQSWKQQPGSSIYCRDLNSNELKNRADALGTTWASMRDTILAKRTSDEALMKADYQAYLKGLMN